MIFGAMASEVKDPGALGLPTGQFMKDIEAGLLEPHRDRANHPFVHKVLRGEATPRQIGGWLLQFRLWADPANKGIAIIYANTPDKDLREALLENIMEEEKGASSGLDGHVALINDALMEFGFSKAEIESAEMLPESWTFFHWLETVMKTRSFLEGICLLSMAERVNPIVFAKLAKGLRAHYRVSERALRAFDVHASDVEVEHGRIVDTAVERYATTRYWQEQVRFIIFHTAELYYRFFNVYAAY